MRLSEEPGSRTRPAGSVGPRAFPPRAARARFVSSVREVVDAEGVQVISNEVYRPGVDRRAVPASPLRSETRDELVRFGYEPAVLGLRPST